MKIYHDFEYDSLKIAEGGNATMIEKLSGKFPATSSYDPEHFEIWEQDGKYYLFCYEVGSTYYGVKIPAEKLEEIRKMKPEDLQGLALRAIYI
jgi:hypothetical protein